MMSTENDSRTFSLGTQPPGAHGPIWHATAKTVDWRRNWKLRRTLSATLARLRLQRHITDAGYQMMLTRHRLDWQDITTAATLERTRLRRERAAAVGHQPQQKVITLYAHAVASRDATEIFRALHLLELAGVDPKEVHE